MATEQPGGGQVFYQRVDRESLPGLFSIALRELLTAYELADDATYDPWEFAIEIDQLRVAGATISELRWCVAKGYAEHAHEVALHEQSSRQFIKSDGLRFSEQSCFVLTEKGFQRARCVATNPDENVAPPPVIADDKPSWDEGSKQLRYCGKLVKHFKWAAQNQERIIAAFEEEGWPDRVDDPLPPVAEQDPKRRLHDTIKCLNRHQENSLIRFRGDGSGEGVLWEPIPQVAQSSMLPETLDESTSRCKPR